MPNQAFKTKSKVTHGPVSSYPHAEKRRMLLQYSARESAHTRYHEFVSSSYSSSSSSSVNPLSPCWNELTGWFFHEASPQTAEACTVTKRSFLSCSSCPVNRWASKGRQWMTPFSANSTCAESARASEALSPVAAPSGCCVIVDKRTRGVLLQPWGNTTGRQLQPVSTTSPFYLSAGPASGVVVAVLLLLGCRFIHIHGFACIAIPRACRG